MGEVQEFLINIGVVLTQMRWMGTKRKTQYVSKRCSDPNSRKLVMVNATPKPRLGEEVGS
jgi:hypothetical protein